MPVAVVTGAARGIGLATVHWFLAQGYRVAMLDIDESTLAQAAAGLSHASDGLALPCDVSDAGQVQAAIGTVAARLGRIDALVNSAGIAVFKPIGETTLQDWRAVMATNLDGAFSRRSWRRTQAPRFKVHPSHRQGPAPQTVPRRVMPKRQPAQLALQRQGWWRPVVGQQQAQACQAAAAGAVPGHLGKGV